jgi:hypothetical protein
MEEPAKTETAVGVEPPVGAGGHDRGEHKFPEAQPAIEIGRARIVSQIFTLQQPEVACIRNRGHHSHMNIGSCCVSPD